LGCKWDIWTVLKMESKLGIVWESLTEKQLEELDRRLVEMRVIAKVQLLA
jgi:hypothetical protein